MLCQQDTTDGEGAAQEAKFFRVNASIIEANVNIETQRKQNDNA